MGYDTDFYGHLEFARDLSDPELAWIDEIINADHAKISPEIDAVLDNERESRRVPGRALMYHGPDEASRRMELLGFIAPKGPPGYIDYAITSDRKGLEYAHAEKSYRMIEGLNFIIANARQRIPDFGLTGQMFASTEFKPYNWIIQIGKDGWAEQVPCDPTLVEEAWRVDERVRESWLDGHRHGWDDAMLEFTRQQNMVKPNLRDRMASIFRRRATSHDRR